MSREATTGSAKSPSAGWVQRFRVATRLAIFSSASFASIALLAALWALSYVGRGFNFSDEGFYLAWIGHPELYKVSSTQFGFVYRPLYWALQGDVARLRVANLMMSFVLGYVLSAAILHRVLAPHATANGGKVRSTSWIRYAQAAPIALTAWSMPHSWLPTPSYNTLVVQGFLLAALGLVMCSAHPRVLRRPWAGTALFSIGAWLSGMAKPPSALLLVLAAIGYLAVTRSFRWGLVLVAAVMMGVLYLSSAIYIDGSVVAFIGRLAEGSRMTALGGAGYDWVSIMRRFLSDPIIFSGTEWWIGASLFAVTAFATRAVMSCRGAVRLAGVVIGLGMAAAALAVIWSDVDLPYQWARFEWVLLLFPVAGCCAGRLPANLRHAGGISVMRAAGEGRWSRRQSVALAAFLLVLPHLTAFGSNNNIWLQGGYAAIFWVLGGIVLASCFSDGPVDPVQSIPAIAATMLLAVSILSASISHPYGQTMTLRAQHSVVALGEGGTRLEVSPDYASYLTGLSDIARKAGLNPGDGVIDLTGYYPGSLFAIGAKPLGRAWFIGGLPGSTKVAVAALDMVPCQDLAQAWLLLQPRGPLRLPVEILSRYGINEGLDYESAGVINAPWPVPGVYFEQQLMKPRRDPAVGVAACERARLDNRP